MHLVQRMPTMADTSAVRTRGVLATALGESTSRRAMTLSLGRGSIYAVASHHSGSLVTNEGQAVILMNRHTHLRCRKPLISIAPQKDTSPSPCQADGVNRV